MTTAAFRPKILAFLCNWCSYAGADLAGVSRIQYPSTIRVIRTMCSCRVNPQFVTKALLMGADGVLVLGCHPGECHYIEGNMYTRRRVIALKRMLEVLGINPDRLRLEWVSASEGTRFADTVESFTTTIRQLGPNTLRGG